MTKPHPVSIAIGLVTDATNRKLMMEIEIILSDGKIVSRTVPANRMVRLDFTESLDEDTDAPRSSEG